MGIFGTPQDQVDLDALKDRVARLEAAVVTLQAQVAAFGAGAAPTGQPVPSVAAATDWMAEVRELKADGKVIQAIKVYREHTGLGLKESKDAVESLV